LGSELAQVGELTWLRLKRGTEKDKLWRITFTNIYLLDQEKACPVKQSLALQMVCSLEGFVNFKEICTAL
jgi:hypothetical protein